MVGIEIEGKIEGKIGENQTNPIPKSRSFVCWNSWERERV